MTSSRSTASCNCLPLKSPALKDTFEISICVLVFFGISGIKKPSAISLLKASTPVISKAISVNKPPSSVIMPCFNRYGVAVNPMTFKNGFIFLSSEITNWYCVSSLGLNKWHSSIKIKSRCPKCKRLGGKFDCSLRLFSIAFETD